MKTLLIIEDDIALRENTAELLELSNYKVHTAPNGKIGIDLARKIQPQLIICDIMMPEVDGYGVLEAVLQDAETSHIPFIFLSAKTEHKQIRKGMDLGADDYLTKPFEEEELLSAIESRLTKAASLAKVAKTITAQKNGGDIRNLHELKNLFDDKGEIKTFQKGDVIYKEGAFSKYIYLILKGVVKNYKMDLSGKELITTMHKADDFLGFTSFSDTIPYQETATAMEIVELAGIPKDELKNILGNNQNVSVELMSVLTDSVSEIKEQLLQMAFSSVRKKTAQSILQFATVFNSKPKQPIKISRNDLASVAGIATESLIRTLSDFKKKGFIEVDGRDIKILNLSALQNVE